MLYLPKFHWEIWVNWREAAKLFSKYTVVQNRASYFGQQLADTSLKQLPKISRLLYFSNALTKTILQTTFP